MNYKKQLVKFDIAKMMNLSLVMFFLPFAVCLLINLLVFDNRQSITGKFYFDFLIFIGGTVFLLALHEGLHAVGFMLFGKVKPKDIGFGAVFQQGALYCTAKKPMTIRAYMAALIMPIIITGIIPLVIVTVFGNVLLIMLFSLMVSGGAGDIVMFMKARKNEPSQLILDHPKAPAYYLVYEEGKEPENFVEATAEMEEELAKSMKTSPFKGKENENKSWLFKAFKIFLFLICSLLAFGIIGIILTL